MANWSADPKVVGEILTVRDQLHASLTRMENFLRDAEHGFAKVEEVWASIQGKFTRAAEGEPLYNEDGEVLDFERDEFELLKETIDDSRRDAEHYPGMLAEMALISLFATYDAFVSDLLTTVFRARPEILRSGKRITAESVLGAASLDELVEQLISREIEEWRLSFKEQIARMDKRFGLSLSEHDEGIAMLSEAHERRHLFVHRGGIVDDRYLLAVPRAEVSRGDRLTIDMDYSREAGKALRTVAGAVAVELPVKCLRIDRAALES